MEAENFKVSEERYRFIADSIPHKVWTSGVDGRANYYNKGWYDYTNTTSLEELRSIIWQSIHPDDLEHSRTLWSTAVENGQDVEIEQRFKRFDGVYLWHLTRMCACKNDNGEVFMYVGTSTNIHERKLAEAALAASEQHFKVLANNNSLLIWQTNENGETIFVNDTWKAYSGIVAEKTHINDWLNNIHPDDLNQAILDFKTGNLKRESYQSKYRFKDNRTGQYRWMLDSAQPLYAPEFRGYIGAMTDIHEQELARQALKELSIKKDQFFQIASHELKTPLTVLQASFQVIAHMLGEHGSTNEVLDLISRANKQIVKLTRIINDLFDINKIQNDQLVFEMSLISFNDVVDDCIAQFKSYATDVELEINQNDTYQISCDSSRIEQVLLSLLDNALKYAGTGKPIKVTTERNSGYIKCSVSDSGIGIPKDLQGQIFERFFRVHSNSQKYSGLGVGLFICSEIIKRHKGEIGIESQVGQGSTLWFTLPLTQQ